MIGDPPPKVGLGVVKRALVAGVLITMLSAAAVASAALLQIDEVLQIVEREGRAPIAIPEIDRAEAGSARTIMVLGSDKRFGDRGEPARSDTIILVRLDPDNDAVSVMSLPRDLKVTIPGNGVQTKINAAYEQGGARLTLRTVKKELSTPSRPFKINHVVSIGFESFQRAVNYVGCVYYDVDQRYFNDNSGGENYAAIDIQPGYQRVCGGDALDFVRYRHTDNDLVRAARQQSFLRELRTQGGTQKFLDVGNIKELARVFSRYLDSDRTLRNTQDILSLGKLAIFAADKPVREIPFEVDGDEENGAYLLASDATIEKTVDQFMAGEVTPVSRRRAATATRSRARRGARRSRSSALSIRGVKDLENATREGEDQALIARSKVDFPIYYPRLKRSGATLDTGLQSEPSTRTYSLRDERGRRHRSYRMSMRTSFNGFGEYYGIQGTTWREPPFLDNPDATVTRNGRKLKLYYDGRKLRTVAWTTDKASYWVSNSLLRTLSNRQLLAIGASLQRLR